MGCRNYYIYYIFINNQNGSKIIMEAILKEIDKVRQKLKKGPADTLLLQKPFAQGMYRFSMFMIGYYSRVKDNLKLDYDSFMIIQTVVSSKLYSLSKNKGLNSGGYKDLENEWDSLRKNHSKVVDAVSEYSSLNNTSFKLSISSICLVTGLPKETVRRKINELAKKNLLKNSKREGILLGPMYKKIFQEFVPYTTLEVSKLIKEWEKSGVLKHLLNFKS